MAYPLSELDRTMKTKDWSKLPTFPWVKLGNEEWRCSKELRYEADDSLTIYVQKERPDDDKVSNWLPAPADEFSIYIRAYWPLDPIMEGVRQS